MKRYLVKLYKIYFKCMIHYRKYKYKRRLINKNPTILSSNCLGGNI